MWDSRKLSNYQLMTDLVCGRGKIWINGVKYCLVRSFVLSSLRVLQTKLSNFTGPAIYIQALNFLFSDQGQLSVFSLYFQITS